MKPVRMFRQAIERPSSGGVFPGDIQGNVFAGYHHQVGASLFVHVSTADGARALLGDVLGDVTSARRWEHKPPSTLNVAFTHPGLVALGLPASVLDSFPAAFREGMAARAALLGDVGRSSPATWEVGLGTGAAHALFEIHAVDVAERERRVAELTALFTRHGVTIVCAQRSARLPDRKEHFGYLDGVGQPAMQGTDDARMGQGSIDVFRDWHGLPIGEIFHGHIDIDGHASPGPAEPFTLNGTYLVWRKLHEDVAGFRRWTAEQSRQLGIDEELLRAKLVGRWSDGTPLALSPDRPDPEIANDPERVNAFDYSDDPDGLRCPLGAHIRRAHPRLGLGFGDALSERQRIIRRGMTYGEALPLDAPDDGADRGIIFAAYMADIERQFEFIQAHWCNDGDAVNVGHDPDPFIGKPTARSLGDAKFTIPGSPPRFVHPLAEVVHTRGGEYLWVPSMRSLGVLASGPVARPAAPRRGSVRRLMTVSPSVRHRKPEAARTSVLERVGGTVLGVALSPLAFTLSFLRGNAVVHPHGVVHDAELEVPQPTMELLAGTVLGEAGVRPAVVRLSFGFGLPKRMNDVRGLAVRIPSDDGEGVLQDLLLATAVTDEQGKEAALRTERFESFFSSLLRFATPNGPIVLRAVSVQPMPADPDVHAGGAAGAAFDITVAAPDGDPQTVARLTLGAMRPLSESARLAFNIAHDAGGITTLGAMNVARTIVYRASHRGRSLRQKG